MVAGKFRPRQVCGKSGLCLRAELSAERTVLHNKTASSDTQLEVVTLDLVFSSFVGVSYDEYGNRYEGNCVQFHCPNAWQYGIDQIDVYIHNVTTPSENNATVWVQMIDGGNGYSEPAACTLTSDSYVDRSMIRVTSTNPNYVFYFNIRGIASR